MLIDYQNVSIYQADKCVLKGINFHVDEGEFAYLIGKVGSGKSSLLKTLYCELDLVEGETDKAEILGRDLKVIKHSGHHLPGLPVAPRPQRAQELRVRAQGYQMEKQEGQRQAH
mgnify:CR=1 FL=1